MMAAVVRRPEGERANVSILDASGEVARVVHFAHDVDATSWASGSDAFAAVGPKGELSVASLLEPESTKPLGLSHEQALIGRDTWSPDGTRLCFVTGTRPIRSTRQKRSSGLTAVDVAPLFGLTAAGDLAGA